MQPHPVIDLSPEKLADKNYLLEHFFVVDAATTAEAASLNAAEYLAKDMTLKPEKDQPQILIYHSHSQETFADSRTGEEADTVVGVGDYLTEILEQKYGYQVIHVREHFDVIGNRQKPGIRFCQRICGKSAGGESNSSGSDRSSQRWGAGGEKAGNKNRRQGYSTDHVL